MASLQLQAGSRIPSIKCNICMLHLICWDGCAEQLQSQPSCSSFAEIEPADQQNLLARASCGHKLLGTELQHATHCVAL